MERLVKGDVVIVPFPFSDLSSSKKRPALVVSVLSGDDCILAQISSRERLDPDAVRLTQSDFERGGLPVDGNVRPNKLFTADQHIVQYVAGRIHVKKSSAFVDLVCQIIRR